MSIQFTSSFYMFLSFTDIYSTSHEFLQRFRQTFRTNLHPPSDRVVALPPTLNFRQAQGIAPAEAAA